MNPTNPSLEKVLDPVVFYTDLDSERYAKFDHFIQRAAMFFSSTSKSGADFAQARYEVPLPKILFTCNNNKYRKRERAQ